MSSSVPSHDLADDADAPRVHEQRARPLRRDSKKGGHPVRSAGGRATRSEYPRPSLSASTGIVSTVRDLARFDGALDDDVLLEADTRRRAWEAAGSAPTGLGWFVQRYNNERIVWHFGLSRDAYSALYIKVPGRKLTLILLANSDGLGAPYTLANGDVTVSLFAQLFLKLFLADDQGAGGGARCAADDVRLAVRRRGASVSSIGLARSHPLRVDRSRPRRRCSCSRRAPDGSSHSAWRRRSSVMASLASRVKSTIRPDSSRGTIRWASC